MKTLDNTTYEISAETAKELMVKTQGTIFTATFEKANHETRVMNCRTGVQKHLSKVRQPRTVRVQNPKYVTVYDLKVKGYRKINTETLTALKIFGFNYKIV